MLEERSDSLWTFLELHRPVFLSQLYTAVVRPQLGQLDYAPFLVCNGGVCEVHCVDPL